MNQKSYERLKVYCMKNRLIETGDGIIVGLSGGADSVYLLHFLKILQEEYALRLYAVHIHHGIRGAEADQDEEYARECAMSLGIPYESFRCDIPLLAKESGMSIEEAGRQYRYHCFREIAESKGYQKIAVAHHKNDQAETVLFQLMRGSGVRGLGGMRPCQNGIIRPLLILTREQIETELRMDGIGWREDSSNQDHAYVRNKLRCEVIPYLKREIQPEVVEHVAETAAQLQEVWAYLDRQVREASAALVHRESDRLWFERYKFLSIDPVLQPYILLELMAEMAGSRKDLGRVHVQGWMNLIQGETGKRISLPYGLQAGKDYEVVWLTRISQTTESLELPWEVQMRQYSRQELPAQIPKNNCTKWFDYAKIGFDSVWRHPMPGDTLVIDQSGHRKKLSRILLDEKIPRERRGQLWVLADGGNVLWVPQIQRVSMGYYVTEETKEVLVVNIYEKGGAHSERDHS